MSVMYKQEQVQASEQLLKKTAIGLSGRWLLLARTVWLTLSILTFGLFQALLGEHTDNVTIIDLLLNELAAFTGPHWEQEDDVTLVTLQRSGG